MSFIRLCQNCTSFFLWSLTIVFLLPSCRYTLAGIFISACYSPGWDSNTELQRATSGYAHTLPVHINKHTTFTALLNINMGFQLIFSPGLDPRLLYWPLTQSLGLSMSWSPPTCWLVWPDDHWQTYTYTHTYSDSKAISQRKRSRV